MINKLESASSKGGSPISVLHPGLHAGGFDTGYFTIGRIDHAHIPSGVVIDMHPHSNDDILSYFRKGEIRHTDSFGYAETIMPSRLMLMRAGEVFYHEEAVIEDMEGLQIFLRPRKKNGPSDVSFLELNEVQSRDQWRIIASPFPSKTSLQVSGDTIVYDRQASAGSKMVLPDSIYENSSFLLYVYNGGIDIINHFSLTKGESAMISNERTVIESTNGAELVLFEVNLEAEYFSGGMYSGNQYK